MPKAPLRNSCVLHHLTESDRLENLHHSMPAWTAAWELLHFRSFPNKWPLPWWTTSAFCWGSLWSASRQKESDITYTSLAPAIVRGFFLGNELRSFVGFWFTEALLPQCFLIISADYVSSANCIVSSNKWENSCCWVFGTTGDEFFALECEWGCCMQSGWPNCGKY